MKKEHLSLICFCLFTYLSFGQITNYDGFTFIGAYAKGTRTSFKFSEDFNNEFLKEFESRNQVLTTYDPERNIGYAFGVSLGVNVAPRMGVLLDAGFSMNTYEYRINELGEHLEIDNILGIYRFEEKHSTISLNPLMRFQVNDDENGIYALIGPHFAVGISGNQKRYFDSADGETLDSEIEAISFGKKDRFTNYKRATVGIVTGIGATFRLDHNIRLNVDIRRQHDIANLYSKERLDYLDTIDEKIVGKKKLRGTALQVGIEYIISADK